MFQEWLAFAETQSAGGREVVPWLAVLHSGRHSRINQPLHGHRALQVIFSGEVLYVSNLRKSNMAVAFLHIHGRL